jgi:predicted TPR repeat methyltransferase
MTDTYLDKIYNSAAPEETRDAFDAWAETYDAELADNGYVTPGRVAKAMAQHIPLETPVLDYGCGTGLSGLALKLAGFQTIDGMDPSQNMLDGAAEKGVYRALGVIDLDDETPIPANTYTAIAAIGVIGTGAAPASTFHILMNALSTGGKLGFSFNDNALAIPEYEAALMAWLDPGKAKLLFKEYGEHLPGINLKSNVYIVEKT